MGRGRLANDRDHCASEARGHHPECKDAAEQARRTTVYSVYTSHLMRRQKRHYYNMLGADLWVLILALTVACCAPASGLDRSPLPSSSQGDRGKSRQMVMPGAPGLLREGIVSPLAFRTDVKDNAIIEAVQQMGISPVQPSICKVPTEAMPPLLDDFTNDISALPPCTSTETLLPDLGFATRKLPHQLEQHQHSERSPWCGSGAGYMERMAVEAGYIERGWAQDGKGVGGGGWANPLAASQVPGKQRDGGWQWSGGGVGGSPIKKGAASGVSGLGASPSPKSLFGEDKCLKKSWTSRRTTDKCLQTVLVQGSGTLGGYVVGRAGSVCWTTGRALDTLLTRFLSYLDSVSSGQVTWRDFHADVCALVTEAASSSRSSAHALLLVAQRTAVELWQAGVRVAGARVLSLLALLVQKYKY